jgi:hypothetical protein
VSEKTIQERLKEANEKVKTLRSSRDQIVGDIRVEKEKLKQAYDNLRELGIDQPEKYSAKDLELLAAELQDKLGDKLTTIEEQLAKGETLMKKYQALQEN